MSPPAEKEIQLEITLPQVGFPKTLYFNRFRVDKDEGFCFVQFGLVVASDLVDSYSCVLTDAVLHHNQPILLGYLTKLGSESVQSVTWKGVTTSRKADVADIISMCYRGDVAEIIFSAFSMCAAANVARGSSGLSLPSQPLVLLRSKTALQKELISVLYG